MRETPGFFSHGGFLDRLIRIQSDIGFKRALGTLEFELVGWDREKDRSDVYARAFLNRQNAEAHRILFHLIDSVVLEDTGRNLQWRHIHSTSLDAPVGIAQWACDQHGGQALGIGLYLLDVTAKLPLKLDLHQPQLPLVSLSPYDHLRRCFRLCHVHFKRKIKTCKVSEEVKNLMRSLVCIMHPNFDEAVAAICEKGGKTGYDKIRSNFAFAGICWEKSFIPKDVWLAAESNTNVSETAHADVNREGTGCTLLGALVRGETFDREKDRSFQAFEESGVRHSNTGSASRRARTNLKRTLTSRLKGLDATDHDIIVANERVATQLGRVGACHNVMAQAEQEYEDSLTGMPPTKRRRGARTSTCKLETLRQSKEKLAQAQKTLHKAEIGAARFIGQGSGKVIPITRGLAAPTLSSTAAVAPPLFTTRLPCPRRCFAPVIFYP
ncbi:hypothetical protein K439DRAFT_1665599 [Ramaria rubella]|nr:hypothetical protein K439DRAFT_1665599 [Ramaria rubella]